MILGAALLVGVLLIGGGVLSWALGFRGLLAVTFAVPFSFSAIAIGSIAAPFLGLQWSVWVYALTIAVLLIIIIIARVVLRRATRTPVSAPTAGPSNTGYVLAAILIPAAILGAHTVSIFGSPDALSQTFDNVFHSNAVRFIVEEGTASPLQVGQMTNSPAFYPTVWHATAALSVQMTGLSIPAGVQALVLVTSAVVWPLSALALVTVLFGTSRSVLLAALVIVPSIPAFPLLMMHYGVLYPFQLSLAILPAAIALVLGLLRVGAVRGDWPWGWWLFAVLGALPGLTLSHPGGFVALLALTLPAVLFVIIAGIVASRGSRRFWWVSGLLLYLGAGLVAVLVLRPPREASEWPPALSPSHAVWQAFSVGMWIDSPSPIVAVAVLIGLVITFVHRKPAIIISAGMWVGGAILFITVSGMHLGGVRHLLTGSWYNNWPRLAAIFAVALVPVAVAGLAWLARQLNRMLQRRHALEVLAIPLAGLTAVAAQFPGMVDQADQARGSYAVTSDAALVSEDEYTLLERAASTLPNEAIIIGNPFSGTSMAYAIAGIEVVMPHILMSLSEDEELLFERLDDAESREEVCAAVFASGVTHVLDFGGREVHGGEHVYAGLDDLDTSPMVRLIDSEGEARLYEVVGC